MNAPDKLTALTSPSLRAAGVSRFHESARAQVAGGATYIDDIPEVRGTLHAAPVCSPVAHGRLKGIDASAALALPGVRGFGDRFTIPLPNGRSVWQQFDANGKPLKTETVALQGDTATQLARAPGRAPHLH